MRASPMLDPTVRQEIPSSILMKVSQFAFHEIMTTDLPVVIPNIDDAPNEHDDQIRRKRSGVWAY